MATIIGAQGRTAAAGSRALVQLEATMARGEVQVQGRGGKRSTSASTWMKVFPDECGAMRIDLSPMTRSEQCVSSSSVYSVTNGLEKLHPVASELMTFVNFSVGFDASGLVDEQQACIARWPLETAVERSKLLLRWERPRAVSMALAGGAPCQCLLLRHSTSGYWRSAPLAIARGPGASVTVV